jgi:hypothetical protein
MLVEMMEECWPSSYFAAYLNGVHMHKQEQLLPEHTSNLRRRDLLKSLVAIAAGGTVSGICQTSLDASALQPYSPTILPEGVRSRFVDSVNGIRMHVLEGGYEERNRLSSSSCMDFLNWLIAGEK